MSANDSIRISNRDIYDLLLKHIEDSRTEMTTHTLNDERRFNRLNVKVYGLMVPLVFLVAGLFTGRVH
jgi:hypothetical protein